MKLIIKLLALIGVIFITLSLVIGFIVYRGVKEKGSINAWVASLVMQRVSPDSKLTEDQLIMITEGNYEPIIKEIEENITMEQVDCAVSVLGQERAEEIAIKKNPTPQEVMKLYKCY